MKEYHSKNPLRRFSMSSFYSCESIAPCVDKCVHGSSVATTMVFPLGSSETM